ncbi:MAG: hypothetical protein ACUVR2_05250 [Anaerolineae bacterium]
MGGRRGQDGDKPLGYYVGVGARICGGGDGDKPLGYYVGVGARICGGGDGDKPPGHVWGGDVDSRRW